MLIIEASTFSLLEALPTPSLYFCPEFLKMLGLKSRVWRLASEVQDLKFGSKVVHDLKLGWMFGSKVFGSEVAMTIPRLRCKFNRDSSNVRWKTKHDPIHVFQVMNNVVLQIVHTTWVQQGISPVILVGDWRWYAWYLGHEALPCQ